MKPTPEQSAAIDKVLASSRESFRNREPGLSDEERRATFRQARRALMEKIAATLDPERRAKFQAIASELRRGGSAQADAGTPGRVYVLDEDGSPKPVPLRLGVTDGSYTEVVAGDLQAGAAVIVGGGPRSDAASRRPRRRAAPARSAPVLRPWP